MLDRVVAARPQERPKLMAIADLLTGRDEGVSRVRFAWYFGIGDRQLRGWIHRFNDGGIEGLLFRSNRKRGRKRKIPSEKFNAEVCPMIRELRATETKPSGRKLWTLVKAMPGCDISYPAFMEMLKRSGISFRRNPYY